MFEAAASWTKHCLCPLWKLQSVTEEVLDIFIKHFDYERKEKKKYRSITFSDQREKFIYNVF